VVAHDDKSIELREIETGLTNGDLVEVRTNLKAGETIVTRGSLFIDRAATAKDKDCPRSASFRRDTSAGGSAWMSLLKPRRPSCDHYRDRRFPISFLYAVLPT